MAILKRSFFVLLALLPALALAQRLPQEAVPEHYSLTFTPDLQKASFTGDEVIQVNILKPAHAITLNSAELEFQSATIEQGGNVQEAKASFDAPKDQATLAVAGPLAPGPATIRIKFTGILNDKLRGFYLSKTRVRNYATTQFESTDARRAFPSFDEPAYKATFDISLIVDKGDTAISNGSIVDDTPGPVEGKHLLRFSTTAKMSTYLVAMAVGDFQCNDGSADGIPIRVCGTPDKKALGVVAVRYAEEILTFYNKYYGIKYPFGKLDIVGLPDFEAGAMENTAAIFYRESLLFIDDKNSSVDSHQAVFEVLAHEMAHQWFGDLVTMKWWDNIWLNEGFATWMALKPSQALHPEWNAALDGVRATNGAMGLDSLRNTHAIRAKAETPEEINELFDAISYEKGAAVLRMVESYVSPEVFQRGVNAYLRKFQYSNAAAEDFWQAITIASGRPVDKIMPTFVAQPGVPLVSVKSVCVAPKVAPPGKRRSRRAKRIGNPQSKTEVTLSQQRFFAEPGTDDAKSPPWDIPVCIKASDAKPFCQLLGQTQQTIPMTGCSTWVFTNAGAAGYYRSKYETEILQKLDAVAGTQLGTGERIALLGDQAALVRSGQQSVGDYLDLVAALNQDAEESVVGTYAGTLGFIRDYLVSDANADAFRSWVRSNFRPLMAKVGWEPVAGEPAATHNLRAELIGILGTMGEDPEAIRRSTELAQKYLQAPNSVDPSLAGVVLAVAARHGDAALFQQYLAARAKMTSPEQFYNVTGALSEFRDPQLMQRWLEMIVSADTRNQDAAGLIAAEIGTEGNESEAWKWVKAHWPEVESKITMSSGAQIIGSTRVFCDAGPRDDVQQFFTEHKVPSSERTLKQTVERINSCISYRDRQHENFAAWLQQHPAGDAAGNR
jgi:aminopeptidase N